MTNSATQLLLNKLSNKTTVKALLLSFVVPFVLIGSMFGLLMWDQTLQSHPNIETCSEYALSLVAFASCSSGFAAGVLGAAANLLLQLMP